MPNCTVCGTRYFTSPYNNSNKCDTCNDDSDTLDEQYEIDLLLNPTGKTPVRTYDDTDDMS